MKLSRAERAACCLCTYIYLPAYKRCVNCFIYRSEQYKLEDGSLVSFVERFARSKSALARGFVLDVDEDEGTAFFAFDQLVFPTGDHRVQRILCDWSARKIERRLLLRKVSYADANLAPLREAGAPLPTYELRPYARLVASERLGPDGRLQRWRGKAARLVAARFAASSSVAAAAAFARIASTVDRALRGAKTASPNFVRVFDYFILADGAPRAEGRPAPPVTLAVVQEATDVDLQTLLQWSGFAGEAEAYCGVLAGVLAQVLAALHAAASARLPVAGGGGVRAALDYHHGALTPASLLLVLSPALRTALTRRRLLRPAPLPWGMREREGGRAALERAWEGGRGPGRRFLLYRFASAAERGEGAVPPDAPPLGPYAAIGGSLFTGHAPSVERLLYGRRGQARSACATLLSAGPEGDPVRAIHRRRRASSSSESPSPSSSSSSSESEADLSLAASTASLAVPVPRRVSAWVARSAAPTAFPDDLSSVPAASAGPSAPASALPSARGRPPPTDRSGPLPEQAASSPPPKQARAAATGSGTPRGDSGGGPAAAASPKLPVWRPRADLDISVPLTCPSLPPSRPATPPAASAGPSWPSPSPPSPAALSQRLFAHTAAARGPGGSPAAIASVHGNGAATARGPASVASAYPAAKEPLSARGAPSAAPPSLLASRRAPSSAPHKSSRSARSLRSLALDGSPSRNAPRWAAPPPAPPPVLPAGAAGGALAGACALVVDLDAAPLVKIAASPAARSRTLDAAGRLSPAPVSAHAHPRTAAGCALPLGIGHDVRRFGAHLFAMLVALEGQNGPMPAGVRALLAEMVGPELTLEELEEWGPAELEPTRDAARREPPPPRALLEHPFLAPLRLVPAPDARTPADFPPCGATLAFVEHPDDAALPPPP